MLLGIYFWWNSDFFEVLYFHISEKESKKDKKSSVLRVLNLNQYLCWSYHCGSKLRSLRSKTLYDGELSTKVESSCVIDVARFLWKLFCLLKTLIKIIIEIKFSKSIYCKMCLDHAPCYPISVVKSRHTGGHSISKSSFYDFFFYPSIPPLNHEKPLVHASYSDQVVNKFWV